jgi:hypothetical protein
MATNIDEISKHLDAEGLKHSKRAEAGDILTGFRMNAYKDAQGEAVLRLVIKPESNGTFLRVFAPFLYSLKGADGAAHPHRDAVFQALLVANYRTSMLQYEFDPNDGEVRASVEFPVEDGTVTQRQVRAILHGIASVVDEADPFLRAALETGRVNHEAWVPGLSPEMAQMMALVQKAGGIEAARRLLEEAQKGKDASPAGPPGKPGRGPSEI